jgi:DNA invertase Pin-like site-specific DNA recombinase
MSLSNLTKQGLQKAKQRGVKLGSPNPEKSIKFMNEGASKAKKEFRIKMSPIIIYLKDNGFKTLQSIADYLNNENISTRTGKKWAVGSVHNLLNE